MFERRMTKLSYFCLTQDLKNSTLCLTILRKSIKHQLLSKRRTVKIQRGFREFFADMTVQCLQFESKG